ncbi:MAG: hypothetical protein WC443_06855 [Desulfobaccales bacterium]
MAVNPKAIASWGLLAEAGGGTTQVITELEVSVAAEAPLTVELEAEEISVELRDEQ